MNNYEDYEKNLKLQYLGKLAQKKMFKNQTSKIKKNLSLDSRSKSNPPPTQAQKAL